MKNEFVMNHNYLLFSIAKNIIGSILVIGIAGLVQTIIDQKFFSIVLIVVIILIPFDIFYECIYVKKYLIKIDYKNIYICEGLIIRKVTVIPKVKVYTVIETEYVFFKKYWKKIELKTIVKDYKLLGIGINDVRRIKEEVVR
ncbi:hypothetical protein [Enterococcus faecalis]|jgi:hypothetical protein|uniref:hypothetical protein n=1 Tax=Enterococcus TaxID=1350 RepID=UPI00080C608A|nr:hypothetical protein [Enterococcus faecalis]ANU71951.1 hypothetical protein A4V06_02270 [Enterococcus faecalis]ARV05047.1 hypothetical protein A6B47_14200 [Enterococcus faecalis]ASU26651.1 hypothetical protein ADH73_11610 [Enterococcus faecalis]MBG9437160.1 hypothetical protein [Enterococcus faecalis]MBG9439977.1 hypothetical protein [Enterococcus faecalis]